MSYPSGTNLALIADDLKNDAINVLQGAAAAKRFSSDIGRNGHPTKKVSLLASVLFHRASDLALAGALVAVEGHLMRLHRDAVKAKGRKERQKKSSR